MRQKDIFLSGEADNWGRRNFNEERVSTVRKELSHILEYLKDGDELLEIGCTFGLNIPTLAQKKINYFGIDPSTESIQKAKKHFPEFTFEVGTADSLKFEKSQFDVVYFGFCLYLVDRADLFRVVAEADRVLKPGGILLITDFDSRTPVKRKYHHLEGVYSYKMMHEKLFLGSPAYSMLDKRVHFVDGQLPKDDDRVATVVLRKEMESFSLID